MIIHGTIVLNLDVRNHFHIYLQLFITKVHNIIALREHDLPYSHVLTVVRLLGIKKVSFTESLKV